jgi:hypothetical protein
MFGFFYHIYNQEQLVQLTEEHEAVGKRAGAKELEQH